MLCQSTIQIVPPVTPGLVIPEAPRNGQVRLPLELGHRLGHLPLLTHRYLQMGYVVGGEETEVGRGVDSQLSQTLDCLLGEGVSGGEFA